MTLPFWAELSIGFSGILILTLLAAKVVSPAQDADQGDASCDCDGYALYPVDKGRQHHHRELVDAVLAGDDWAARRLYLYARTITNHPECWFARGDMVLKADFCVAWQRAVEVAGENSL